MRINRTGALACGALIFTSIASASGGLVDETHDPWGNNVSGAVNLLVDMASAHVYLEFTGYPANPTMGFGMFALTSASGSLLPANTNDMSVFLNQASVAGPVGGLDGEDSTVLSNGINCCCQFNGYGITVAEMTTLSGMLALNKRGYYQYDLGQVYNNATGEPDLVLYYTNLASMYPIAGQSSVVSLGWGAMASGASYEIPVHSVEANYLVGASSVPEPAAMGVMALGAGGLLFRKRRTPPRG